MSGKTTVQVHFPEGGDNGAKTIITFSSDGACVRIGVVASVGLTRAPTDTTESVIEKINNKLRVESGAGILSVKANGGSEITLGAGDAPYDVWSRNGGADGCQVLFRPRNDSSAAPGVCVCVCVCVLMRVVHSQAVGRL